MTDTPIVTVTELAAMIANDDFFGGNRVERDPLLAMSTHVIYDLRKGRWISADANYFNGARSTQNGMKSDDKQDNSRFGMTYSFPLTPRHSIKLFASTGVFTMIGNDFDSFGAAWLYRFWPERETQRPPIISRV